MSGALLRPARRWPRPRMVAVVALAVLVVVLALFAIGASRQSREQNRVTAADQGSDLYYARQLQEPQKTVLNRNRMPLEPYLVSLVVERGATRARVHEVGKQVGFAVALVSLVILAAWMWRRSGPVPAVTAVAVVALTVYQFKAPYLQPDLLYYGLFTVAFFGLAEVLRRPRPMVGACAGFAVGLAQLAKSGALVLLALFVLVAVVTVLWRLRRDRAFAARLAGSTAAVLLLFVCVVAPYATNSKNTYGSYAYNVNTTYYAWYDSWDEVVAGTLSHGDFEGPADLPADQIPSPRRYARTHSVGDVLARFRQGADTTRQVVFDSYGYAAFCAVLVAIALLLALLQPRRVLRWARTELPALCFGAMTFVAYTLISFWWVPISDGNRFVLCLFLPLVIVSVEAIRRLGRPIVIPIGPRAVDAATLSFVALTAGVLVFGTWAAFGPAGEIFGGT